MKLRLILLSATALAAPALAQHSGHAAPAQSAATADPNCAPEHAAMGHCTPAKTPPPAHPATSDPNCPPEHAAMGHCTPAKTPPPAPDPKCPPEHAAMGHCTPAAAPVPADPHAGHDMRPAEAPAPPDIPPPAAALSGPAHAADLVFGTATMAGAREALRKEHGDIVTSKLLIDRAELKVRDGRDGYAWDSQAWYGGDIDKFWVKTEGEGALRDSVEKAEVQALWSHAIDPWFDLQLGVRHDFRPDPERTYLVAGVQGLAPYWFEVDGALFVSNKGELSARMEGEYDLRITQRLILQPSAEVEFAFQDVPEIGMGSGLSSAGVGARLRYEIQPEFAPYLGVEYERAFGDSAEFARARGEGVGGWSLLLGLRTWF